jgi:hypothetical protein
VVLNISKGSIDRAGMALVEWWDSAPQGASVPMVALERLLDFRSAFPDPMRKVTVGLRQFIGRERDRNQASPYLTGV